MGHDMYADMYANLSNEIDMQLILDDSFDSKMFVNKREFIKYCKGRLDILVDKAPPIPKGIIRKYSECTPILCMSQLASATRNGPSNQVTVNCEVIVPTDIVSRVLRV
jgi:hypothetical protein